VAAEALLSVVLACVRATYLPAWTEPVEADFGFPQRNPRSLPAIPAPRATVDFGDDPLGQVDRCICGCSAGPVHGRIFWAGSLGRTQPYRVSFHPALALDIEQL
jgi:hypothetical protein